MKMFNWECDNHGCNQGVKHHGGTISLRKEERTAEATRPDGWIGVKATATAVRDMDFCCFDCVIEFLRSQHKMGNVRWITYQ